MIQGYPLAPLLFILVVEGLGKSLEEENVSRMFKGIKMGSSLFNSHPLFFMTSYIFVTSPLTIPLSLNIFQNFITRL